MIDRMVTSATVTEPITLAEAKVVCAVDADLVGEDAHILHLIRSARHFVENDLARYRNPVSLARVQWLNGWGYWPRTPWVQLRRFPATALVSVEYQPAEGVLTEIPLDDVYLDVEQGRVSPVTFWPDGRLGALGLRITYEAGYSADTVPPELKEAMFSLIAHWFENRELVVAGTQYRAEAKTVPFKYVESITPFRSRRL